MSEKINSFELSALYVSAVIGVGILTLPRRAAEGAGVDGVLATMIAGLIFTFVAYIFSKLAIKFKTQTIFEFSESLIGKYLTRVIALIVSVYFITIVLLQVRSVGMSVKQFLLYETPIEVLIITMLLIVAITINYGIVPIARICSNYYIATMSMLIIILFLSLKYFNMETLYPMFSNGLGKIFKTAIKLTFDFTGFEIILFIAPFLVKPKSAVKVSVFSMLAITLIYTLSTAICLGEFGLTPSQYIIQPTAVLSKAIFISGFAERIDLLFMVFWVLEAYVSMTVMWFMASYAMSKIIPQKNYTVFTFLSLPLMYTLSLIPQNLGELAKVSDIVIYFAWFGIIPIVVILYILSFIRKRGERANEVT